MAGAVGRLELSGWGWRIFFGRGLWLEVGGFYFLGCRKRGLLGLFQGSLFLRSHLFSWPRGLFDSLACRGLGDRQLLLETSESLGKQLFFLSSCRAALRSALTSGLLFRPRFTILAMCQLLVLITDLS